MAIKNTTKAAINKIIFERAYEIEQILSDDDFFLAKMCGISPVTVESESLKLAVKELKKEFSQ